MNYGELAHKVGEVSVALEGLDTSNMPREFQLPVYDLLLSCVSVQARYRRCWPSQVVHSVWDDDWPEEWVSEINLPLRENEEAS